MEDKTFGGVLIALFMLIIVGLVLFQASAQEIGNTVNTIGIVNQTLTAPALNGFVNLQGKEVSNVVVWNSTPVLRNAANYTIQNNRVVDGAFAPARLQSNDANMAGSLNVSYTYEPYTYIDDGGGRAMANLIPIMFALAILIIVLLPTLRERFDL